MSSRYTRLQEVPFRKIEVWPPGYLNPKTIVRVEGDKQSSLFDGPGGPHYLDSGCGSGDDVTVFRIGDDYIVMSYGRLPYIGIARFSPGSDAETDSGELHRGSDDDPDTVTFYKPEAEAFFQGSEQVEDAFESDLWRNWSDERRVEKLLNSL